MTDPIRQVIAKLRAQAEFHRPERIDHHDPPEYTWKEIRELSDLLAEAADAIEALAAGPRPQAAVEDLRGLVSEASEIMTIVYAGNFPAGIESFLIRADRALKATPPAPPATQTEDIVCRHGTAMDVHCCNCHSGFLFDIDSCVCDFGTLAATPPAPPAVIPPVDDLRSERDAFLEAEAPAVIREASIMEITADGLKARFNMAHTRASDKVRDYAAHECPLVPATEIATVCDALGFVSITDAYEALDQRQRELAGREVPSA
jgi:hypothetical protein